MKLTPAHHMLIREAHEFVTRCARDKIMSELSIVDTAKLLIATAGELVTSVADHETLAMILYQFADDIAIQSCSIEHLADWLAKERKQDGDKPPSTPTPV